MMGSTPVVDLESVTVMAALLPKSKQIDAYYWEVLRIAGHEGRGTFLSNSGQEGVSRGNWRAGASQPVALLSRPHGRLAADVPVGKRGEERFPVRRLVGS